MLTLTRQTRFYLPLEPLTDRENTARQNRWHAWGTIRPTATYVVVETTVAGVPDPEGGYLVDIRHVDQILIEACRRVQAALDGDWNADPDAWQAIRQFATMVWEHVRKLLADRTLAASSLLELTRMVWRFTPYWALTLTTQATPTRLPDKPVSPTPTPEPPSAATTMTQGWPNSDLRSLNAHPLDCRVTQQYEFAAAHRLHCPEWTEQQNREVFGKCNHPSGHGHNYRLEVTLRWEASQSSPRGAANGTWSEQVNEVVNRHVIEKVDHRFLNLDLEVFRDLNPTVENIARVVFEWLDGKFPRGLQLVGVKVYETDKTWSEVQRPAAPIVGS
jgi:6-pyruvoyltetrahydropterin/6-carboxytetrahydropterin synthase